MFNFINHIPMSLISTTFVVLEFSMFVLSAIMITMILKDRLLKSKSEKFIFCGFLVLSIVVVFAIDYSFYSNTKNNKVVKNWKNSEFKIETKNLLQSSQIELKKIEQCTVIITETKQINLGNGIKNQISTENIITKPCERVVARLDCGKNTLDECMNLVEKNMEHIKTSIPSEVRNINDPDQPVVIRF